MKLFLSIALGAILGAVTFDLYADDVITQAGYESYRLAKSEKTLGLMPVIVGDSVKMKMLDRASIAERKKIAAGNFWKYFPSHCTYYSTFTSVAACTTNVLYKPVAFNMGSGHSLTIPVPANELFPICKTQNPRFWLIVEIPFAYDDVSNLAGNLWFFSGFIAGSPVSEKPEEECIHYVCTFVLWDSFKHTAASYGYVTAEGCGLRIDRYGPGGAWDGSLSELAKQIFEDTPFEMETQ
jgi:hypothetical protein